MININRKTNVIVVETKSVTMAKNIEKGSILFPVEMKIRLESFDLK